MKTIGFAEPTFSIGFKQTQISSRIWGLLPMFLTDARGVGLRVNPYSGFFKQSFFPENQVEPELHKVENGSSRPDVANQRINRKELREVTSSNRGHALDSFHFWLSNTYLIKTTPACLMQDNIVQRTYILTTSFVRVIKTIAPKIQLYIR